LRNDSGETVTIGAIEPDCRCTVASIDKRTLLPSEGVALEVRVDLNGLSGSISRSVAVFTSDPKSRPVLLAMEVNVRKGLTIQPRSVFFSQIGEKTPEPVTIMVETHDPALLVDVVDAVSTSGCFAATVRQVAPHRAYAVDVSLRMPLPDRYVAAEIVLHTNSAVIPIIRIPVSGRARKGFNVVPDRLVILRGSPAVTRYIAISGIEEFDIQSIHMPSARLKFEVQLAGNHGYLVRVDGLDADEELNGKAIRIELDRGAPIEVPIQLDGPYRQEPGQHTDSSKARVGSHDEAQQDSIPVGSVQVTAVPIAEGKEYVVHQMVFEIPKGSPPGVVQADYRWYEQTHKKIGTGYGSTKNEPNRVLVTVVGQLIKASAEEPSRLMSLLVVCGGLQDFQLHRVEQGTVISDFLVIDVKPGLYRMEEMIDVGKYGEDRIWFRASTKALQEGH